ncbi:Six-hairpin glycosidase-like protein [Mariannaea sp. PMI_226]|nr:Six-hairpin glycosidase-like protein [Mariannaea sp. PMI_226]
MIKEGVSLPWGNWGDICSSSPWILTTDSFVPNRYQNSPYVANGYFGQRLPAEGVGYWVYKDESTQEDLLNSWPLDQPRATFGTISGFWNVQQKMPYALVPDNLKRGGESVISGIPDWTGLTVTTPDGQTYQPGVRPSTVRGYHQSMSVHDGIVHTNVTWSPPVAAEDTAAVYQLNYTVFAHRTRLNLGIVRLDISADQDVSFTLTDVLDGAGAERADFSDKALLEDNVIWTSVKPWQIEYCTAHIFSAVRFQCNYDGDDSEGEDEAEVLVAQASQSRHDGSSYPWVSTNTSTVAQSWNWQHLRKGRSMTVYKFVGIASSSGSSSSSSSRATGDTTFQGQGQEREVAQRAALEARDLATWEQLVLEHSAAWDATWEDADILIPDDEDLQIRTRASLFHLLSSLLPQDNSYSDSSGGGGSSSGSGLGQNSISVGGLSSDSYAGLIFWDAETWVYPSVLALYPQYAAGINSYRGRLLGQAVENAQFYGCAGSLYPWTSGRFGNCTGTGACRRYQYHLNSDIALAHWQYFLQTRDLAWLKSEGWPVIKNVADMFAAYVVYNETSAEYNTIMLAEPDEFAYHINNGAFTNAAIKQLLGDWAPAAARLLHLDVPQNWSHISDNMYIPYNPESQIIIEFDGMDGNWEVKQASVGLINYPLGFQLSKAQARHDVAYYSSVNTADGPAMTWSIYAISEAELQQKGCAAYTYIQRSSEPYVRAPYYQFSETRSDTQLPGVSNPAFIFGHKPAFPFLTGAGGFLQVFTHGVTGMRPNLDAFYLDPMLPPQLPSGVTVKGMKWQGAVFDVSIGPETTTVTRRQPCSSIAKSVDMERATVRILGGHGEVQEHQLAVGESITAPTRRPDMSSDPQDLALCKQVSADGEWAPGNYPYSLVDGSNATVWQPTNADKDASVTIDLGGVRSISKIILNWAAAPPLTYSLSGSLTSLDFELLSSSQQQPVEISAPYNAEEARRVEIRAGNITEVELASTARIRFLKLTMQGSHVADGLGATVAEVQVIAATEDRNTEESAAAGNQRNQSVIIGVIGEGSVADGQNVGQTYQDLSGAGAAIKQYSSSNASGEEGKKKSHHHLFVMNDLWRAEVGSDSQVGLR